MSKIFYYYIPRNKEGLRLLKFVYNKGGNSKAFNYSSEGWVDFYNWTFTSLFLNNFKDFMIPEKDVGKYKLIEKMNR